MQYKFIKIPIFERMVYFYKGTHTEATDHFNAKKKAELSYSDSENPQGLCYNFSDGSCLIVICKESPNTISHEISHGVNNIMTNLFEDYDRRTSKELEAYLVGYVTEQYYKTTGWK